MEIDVCRNSGTGAGSNTFTGSPPLSTILTSHYRVQWQGIFSSSFFTITLSLALFWCSYCDGVMGRSVMAPVRMTIQQKSARAINGGEKREDVKGESRDKLSRTFKGTSSRLRSCLPVPVWRPLGFKRSIQAESEWLSAKYSWKMAVYGNIYTARIYSSTVIHEVHRCVS